MAILDIEIHYHLHLTSDELRLVIAGLYGGIKDHQKQDALDLQKKILDIKNKKIKSLSESTEKYFNNLTNDKEEKR